MTNFTQNGPLDWETNFNITQAKVGSDVFTIKPSAAGKYKPDAEGIEAALAAILSAKAIFDGWKIWLDGEFDVKLDKGENCSPAKLAKIIKQADHIQLAFVKRPFPQPKLRFVLGDGLRPTKAKAVSQLKSL